MELRRDHRFDLIITQLRHTPAPHLPPQPTNYPLGAKCQVGRLKVLDAGVLPTVPEATGTCEFFTFRGLTVPFTTGAVAKRVNMLTHTMPATGQLSDIIQTHTQAPSNAHSYIRI